MSMSTNIHGFTDQTVLVSVTAANSVVTIQIGTDQRADAPAIPGLCDSHVNVFLHGRFDERTVALLDEIVEQLLAARLVVLRETAGRQ